jgi:type VI secretion system protein ImpA
MTVTAILDVEQLLSPISEDLPSGVELLISDPDGPFQTIKDKFDDARKLVKEKQDRDIAGGVDSFGNPWRTISTPNWRIVIQLGESILSEQSKDFRVASWVTEALMREHHLVGLRDGLRLCIGLCERYWSDIHPPANEEDGHGATVAAFNSLVMVTDQAKRIDIDSSAVLSAPVIRGIKPGERTERGFSTLDYLRAKELEGLSNQDERNRRLELGHLTLSDFLAAASSTDPAFIAMNQEVVSECISLCDRLGEFFRNNCQPDEYGEDTAPGMYDFKEQLNTVRRLLNEIGGNSSDAAIEKAGEDAQDSSNLGAVTVTRSQDMTRESALQMVEKVAQFFERTEPHSPIYFALRQVVRWGRMPFPELLAELINDESVMQQLRKQIGLPERSESE